jgi:hypothetical protein
MGSFLKQSFNSRFFCIGGINVRVDSDLAITDRTFAPEFKKFQVAVTKPIAGIVVIVHHFQFPDLHGQKLGQAVYQKPPWAIYRKGHSWIYFGIAPNPGDKTIHQVAVFNRDHSRGHIYTNNSKKFLAGKYHSLALMPTDQIWLARVLAERQGFFIHAAGMVINGQGLLFAGHSEAGKSTMVKMLRSEGKILCDDRIIVRRWNEGFRVHGTWSHGDIAEVSAAEAPLKAILFLEKARTNRLIPIKDAREVLKRVLPLIIRPLVTADWWEKTLAVVEKLVREVPAFRLQFDKSGKIKAIIRELVADHKNKGRSCRKSRLP